MDQYKELANKLQGLHSAPDKITIYQGIVKKVHGNLCDLQVGNLLVEDVRLKAAETSDKGELLIIPAIDSAVTVGSLSGDLSQLVVIAYEKIDSVKVTGTVTFNGGELGGMVNVKDLTDKLNGLVRSFNNHIHTTPNGPSGVPTELAQEFNASDYEDEKIKH